MFWTLFWTPWKCFLKNFLLLCNIPSAVARWIHTWKCKARRLSTQISRTIHETAQGNIKEVCAHERKKHVFCEQSHPFLCLRLLASQWMSNKREKVKKCLVSRRHLIKTAHEIQIFSLIHNTSQLLSISFHNHILLCLIFSPFLFVKKSGNNGTQVEQRLLAFIVHLKWRHLFTRRSEGTT